MVKEQEKPVLCKYDISRKQNINLLLDNSALRAAVRWQYIEKQLPFTRKKTELTAQHNPLVKLKQDDM